MIRQSVDIWNAKASGTYSKSDMVNFMENEHINPKNGNYDSKLFKKTTVTLVHPL